MSTKSKSKTEVDDPFFNMEEAAKYLGQSKRWVKGQLAEGNLPVTKMGRLVRIRKSHLDRYIEEHTKTPEANRAD